MDPWKVTSSSSLFRSPLFGLRKDRLRAPHNGSEHDFYVLEAADWVNVVALTSDGRVVLVRQYRHGTASISTEIPGGVIEPGEAPLQAARRELREETGYEADEWEQIGLVEPNPAIQANRTWTFLARGARKTSGLQLDPGEDIEVELMTLSEVPGMLRRGEIRHALVACAFLHLVLAGKMPV